MMSLMTSGFWAYNSTLKLLIQGDGDIICPHLAVENIQRLSLWHLLSYYLNESEILYLHALLITWSVLFKF